MTTRPPRSRAAAQAGAALWATLMPAWLPAAAQQPPPPPRQGPPDMPAHGMGGPVGGPAGGPGQDGGRGGGPLSELAKAEADEAASQAIADLARAQLPDVQRVVRTWGPMTALRYFDVSPKAFHDAATPRLVAAVKAAARDALIPAEEADRIVDRLEHEGPPPMRPPQ